MAKGSTSESKLFRFHYAVDATAITGILCTANCPLPEFAVASIASCADAATKEISWNGMIGSVRELTFDEYTEYSSANPLTTTVPNYPCKTVDHCGTEQDTFVDRAVPACIVDTSSRGFCKRVNLGRTLNCTGSRSNMSDPTQLRCCSRFRDGASVFMDPHTRLVKAKEKQLYIHDKLVNEDQFSAFCYDSDYTGKRGVIETIHHLHNNMCAIHPALNFEEFTVHPRPLSRAENASSSYNTLRNRYLGDSIYPSYEPPDSIVKPTEVWNGVQFYSYSDQIGGSSAKECDVTSSHFLLSGGSSMCHFTAYSCPPIVHSDGLQVICPRTAVGKQCTVSVPRDSVCNTTTIQCVRSVLDPTQGNFESAVQCTQADKDSVVHNYAVVYIMALHNTLGSNTFWLHADQQRVLSTTGDCARSPRARLPSTHEPVCPGYQFRIERSPQANYRLKRSNGDTESLVRLRSVLYHNKAIECDTQSSQASPGKCSLRDIADRPGQWFVLEAPSSETTNIVQDVGEGVIVRMRLSATSGNDARYISQPVIQGSGVQPIEPITSFDSLGATNFIVYYGHMPTERKVCLGQQPSYWPRKVSQNRTENPVTESFRGCLQGFTEIATEEECQRAAIHTFNLDDVDLLKIENSSRYGNIHRQILTNWTIPVSSKETCRDYCYNLEECNCYSYNVTFGNNLTTCKLFSKCDETQAEGNVHAVALDRTKYRAPGQIVTRVSATQWKSLPPGCVWVKPTGQARWQIQFNYLRQLLTWNRDSPTHELDETVPLTLDSKVGCTASFTEGLNISQCRLALTNAADRSQILQTLGIIHLHTNVSFTDRTDECIMHNCAPMAGCSVRYNIAYKAVELYFGEKAEDVDGFTAADSVAPWCGPCSSVSVSKDVCDSPFMHDSARQQLLKQVGLSSNAEVVKETDTSVPAHVGCSFTFQAPSSVHPWGKIIMHFRSEQTGSANVASGVMQWCGLNHNRAGIDMYRRTCMRPRNADSPPEIWKTDTYGAALSYPYSNGRHSVVFNSSGDYTLMADHGLRCRDGYKPIVTIDQCRRAANELQISTREVDVGDGFVVNRKWGSPGCTLDIRLPEVPGPQFDTEWIEPQAMVSKQHGDNMVNFNLNTLHTMHDFESRAFTRGHSWARGAMLCVVASRHQPQYIRLHEWVDISAAVAPSALIIEKNSAETNDCKAACSGHSECLSYRESQSDGCQLFRRLPLIGEGGLTFKASKFLRVTDMGLSCPNRYKPIESFVQCKEAYSQYLLDLSGGFSKHWIDPVDFVKSVLADDDSDPEEYIPGCLLLPHSNPEIQERDRKYYQFTFNAYRIPGSTSDSTCMNVIRLNKNFLVMQFA